MNNYVPFLKFKVNEIGALSKLTADIKQVLVPFLDFPRKNLMDSNSFIEMVNKAVKSTQKNLSHYNKIYLDNFDIDDGILIGGADNYQYIIDSFKEVNFIPVVGLDRTTSRNQIVFTSKADGKILSQAIALRLQCEDFEDFEMVEEEIQSLIDQGEGLFTDWILIIDNRVCLTIDVNKRINEIITFISEITALHDFNEIVITGSSIPASIGEIVATETEVVHERIELFVFKKVSIALDNLSFSLGDYTIVSPLYSDINIPPEAMRNVTAPKLTYSFENSHMIFRGGALTSHARGSLQYNDMARKLVSIKTIYREELYSTGDKYISDKANMIGTQVTPSSILNPTINAHMTFMCRDFII